MKMTRLDDTPMVLVGLQADRESEREVTKEEGQAMAMGYGCPFLEASSKQGMNVKQAFHDVVREIRLYHKAQVENGWGDGLRKVPMIAVIKEEEEEGEEKGDRCVIM
jgi:GTPase KRas